jgi:hypothetical protein
MPIIFKLIGNIKLKVLEIKYDINGIVRLSSIISIFKNYGIPSENFEHIKFIVESEHLNNDSKFFEVSDNYNLIVFIFTSKKEINDKLIKIFSKNNDINEVDDIDDDIDDEELTKSIVDKIEEEIPELSQDIINSNNTKTLELFENPNFKHLIKIYFNEPNIFKTFLQFISHGDITNMTIPISNQEKDYSAEIEHIKSLGITESDEVILHFLKKYNGHINLSLRAFLCQKAMI